MSKFETGFICGFELTIFVCISGASVHIFYKTRKETRRGENEDQRKRRRQSSACDMEVQMRAFR